ncbi:9601_t:CDS:1, partial [Cetraspora pellucida]
MHTIEQFAIANRVRRMSKPKTRNSNKSRSEGTISVNSAETVGFVSNQEGEDPTTDIESRTRSYIDIAIQAASVSIMQNMQQLINRQAETQREWNAQLMDTINQRL